MESTVLLDERATWLPVSLNAAAVAIAFVLAVLSWYCCASEQEDPVMHADVPGWVEEHAWQDVAKDRPNSFPWELSRCQTVQDVVKHLWRVDDESVDESLAAGDLKECYEEILSRTTEVKFLEAQPPVPGELKGSDFASHWLAYYKLSDGSAMFGGAPHGRREAEGGSAAVELGGLRQRKGLLRRLVERSAVPELLQNCPAAMRAFYEIHDGVGAMISKSHAPSVVAVPQLNTHGSGYYVYPLRSCRPWQNYNGLVALGRVDARCTACVVRSSNSVAYVEHSGEKPEVVEETAMEWINDTVGCLAGSLKNDSLHFG